MKNQGKIKYSLGIEFTYEHNITYMHQKRYLQGLLGRVGMKDRKPKYTPTDCHINKISREPRELTEEKSLEA